MSYRRQRGVALVIAMLVFALSTALIVAIKSEFTLFMKRMGNSYASEQAYAYLRGGEDLAALVLKADYDLDQKRGQARDDLSELWAQGTTPYALDEGGWLVGELSDLQGLINLNSVAATASGEQRFTAAQQQFIRLLQTPEEPRVSEQDAILITEALMDWLDSDTTPRDFGAEDDYYFDMTPSYRAANRPMRSVSELRGIAYMTPELYAQIAPLVTVWPDNYKVNIHTAPAAVLRTINADGDYRPLSVAEGENLLLSRQEGDGFEDLAAFLALAVFEDRELRGVKANLGETSEYFAFRAEAEVAERRSRLYSVLRRRGRDVTTLVRASGPL